MTEKLKLLNLGSGRFAHKDWINLDFCTSGSGVIAHNLLKGVPFSDNEFDAVYHSHLLEHFSKENGELLIEECYRVLKPKGLVRIVVPDLEGMVREYLEWLELAKKGGIEAELNYNWLMLEMYDQTVRNSSGGEMAKYLSQTKIPNESYVMERIGIDIQDSNQKKAMNHFSEGYIVKLMKSIFNLVARSQFGKYFLIGRFRMSGEVHQWMYDSFSLGRLLEKKGFTNIEVKSAFESKIPDFNQYGLDTYQGKHRGVSSLFMEASKPED